MALTLRYLVDTSAFGRMRHGPVAERLGPMVEQGLVATCAMLDFEALWSVPKGRDVRSAYVVRRTALGWVPTESEDLERALAVMMSLAERGQHRSVKWTDLVLAAVAERHRLTLVHYDADFDAIATVTGQPVEWVVAKGSVP